ncbi:MAG: hypothetical protein HZC12_06260 [Nitrospirae bacterium]|nr:hypothetical protein [Nitrospirota bacterium]
MYTLLLIVHVTSIVLWIGGVAFVTIVMFPIIQRTQGSIEKVLMFQGIEHRFARLARVLSLLAGLTGFLLLHQVGFSILLSWSGIGIWAMIIAWAVYVLILFFLEPIVFRKLFSQKAQLKTEQVFFRLQVFHWFLLGLSLFAVAAGVWTGHH